jgi:hypothetical protein
MLQITGECGDGRRLVDVTENLEQVYRKEETLIQQLSLLVRE